MWENFPSSSASIILFIVRTIVRVEEYIDFLISHNEYYKASASSLSMSGPQSCTRGLYLRDGSDLEFLKEARARMRRKLDGTVYNMLDHWCESATKQRKMPIACCLHAHLAFLFRNYTEKDFNKRSVMTILIAQIFLTTNYRFNADVQSDDIVPPRKSSSVADRREFEKKVNRGLQIDQTEIFSLLQRHRRPALNWLETHPEDCNSVMEAIVRVITLTGNKEELYADASRTDEKAAAYL